VIEQTMASVPVARPPRRQTPAIPAIALSADLDADSVVALAGPPLRDGPEHLSRLVAGLEALRACHEDVPVGRSTVARLALRHVAGKAAPPRSVREIVSALHATIRPSAVSCQIAVSVSRTSIDQPIRTADAVRRVLHTLALEAVAYLAGHLRVEVYDTAGESTTFVVRGMRERRPVGTASGHTAGSATMLERSWEASGCGLAIMSCHRLVAALGSELGQRVLPTGERRYWFALATPRESPG